MLNKRIEAIIRAWPQWSPSEERNMDAIVEEILDHCRNGSGNTFIAEWCKRNLQDLFTN